MQWTELPFPVDNQTLIVCYNAAAEAGFLHNLGLGMPAFWLDLMAESRAQRNVCLAKKHMGRRQAHGKGEAELGIEVLFDARGNALVGHPEWAPEAGQVAKAFVYRIFFNIGGIAPDNSKEALGEQAGVTGYGRQPR
jgi:hypothetical protein